MRYIGLNLKWKVLTDADRVPLPWDDITFLTSRGLLNVSTSVSKIWLKNRTDSFCSVGPLQLGRSLLQSNEMSFEEITIEEVKCELVGSLFSSTEPGPECLFENFEELLVSERTVRAGV